MTFGAHHYVPVLKVKRGEKRALRELSQKVRTRVTPLLEIVERTDKNIVDHLDTAFKGLADAVQLFDRCFIDVWELERDGPAAAKEVFDLASGCGMNYTPVTGISRSADVDAAMAHRSNGLAIRLRRDEFEAGGIGSNISRFMNSQGLTEEGTDLIIDLGAVEDFVAVGVKELASAFLAEVPSHTRWKTFTISACAFPRSMGIVERNSDILVERSDWLAWRDARPAHKQARLPTYSDGAIQHPLGVEGFDPRYMQVSASVRYAIPDHWLLVKGEGTRFNPPSKQFPALATQLVYGHLKDYYCGIDHCKGCASMKDAADGMPKLGSPEVWRRLGTVHHITTVVEELDALP